MERDELVLKYEEQVNRRVFSLLRIVFLIIMVYYIVDIIFLETLIDNKINILMKYSQWIIVFVPLLYYKLSKTKTIFKYMATGAMLCLCFNLFITAWVYSMPFWFLPLVFANLYTDKKLVKIVGSISSVLLILGSLIQYSFIDVTITNDIEITVRFAINMLFSLIILVNLIVNATDKSIKMIDESITLQEENNELLNKTRNSAVSLKTSVNTLNENSGESTQAVEQVAISIQEISEATGDFVVNIQNVNETINEFNKNFTHTFEKTNQVKDYTNEIVNTTKTNQKQLYESVKEIKKIKNGTTASEKMVNKFVEKTNEIEQVTALISEIANQTKLLSLNASIEAARAGNEGLGFSIIAEEIAGLAKQSANSTVQINNIVEEILDNLEAVLNQTTEIDDIATHGLSLITDTTDKYTDVFEKQEDILTQLTSIEDTMKNLTNKGSLITKTMNRLNGVNTKNNDRIGEISATVEELNASFVEIDNQVKSINEEANNLL